MLRDASRKVSFYDDTSLRLTYRSSSRISFKILIPSRSLYLSRERERERLLERFKIFHRVELSVNEFRIKFRTAIERGKDIDCTVCTIAGSPVFINPRDSATIQLKIS